LLVAHVAPLKPSDEQMLLEVGCKFMRGREALSPLRGLRSQIVIRLAEAMVFALVRREDWIESQQVQGAGMHSSSFRMLFEMAGHLGGNGKVDGLAVLCDTPKTPVSSLKLSGAVTAAGGDGQLLPTTQCCLNQNVWMP
jgi:hypothetical protein